MSYKRRIKPLAKKEYIRITNRSHQKLTIPQSPRFRIYYPFSTSERNISSLGLAAHGVALGEGLEACLFFARTTSLRSVWWK